MGVDEENLQVKDVDVILEKLYILTSTGSDYGVYLIHIISYILFVTAEVRDKPAGSGSGYIHGFLWA